MERDLAYTLLEAISYSDLDAKLIENYSGRNGAPTWAIVADDVLTVLISVINMAEIFTDSDIGAPCFSAEGLCVDSMGTEIVIY